MGSIKNDSLSALKVPVIKDTYLEYLGAPSKCISPPEGQRWQHEEDMSLVLRWRGLHARTGERPLDTHRASS